MACRQQSGFEKFMSISEKETYLKTHATIAQLPNAINFVGDHIMGVGPKIIKKSFKIIFVH